jgi:protein phosphatase
MHAADRYAQETSRTPRDEVAPSGRLADAASVSPHSPAPLVLDLPADALVVLIGSAGTGKSTWAARHFEPYQVVSSDACRALVADDPADQGASHDAFRLFHQIVRDRLKRGLLTVADSTALTPAARRDLLSCAAEYGRPAVAVLFDLPAEVAREWNARRARRVPDWALQSHEKLMRQARLDVQREGFAHVYLFETVADLDQARLNIGHVRPENDRPPFDVVGDIHGCLEELRAVLHRLGYQPAGQGYAHPEGRRAVFVGDLVDRGPSSVGVLEVVLAMRAAGTALLVPGNHDNKFMRWLMGRPVRIARQGLAQTIEEGNALPPDVRDRLWQSALDALREAPGYLLLDDGRLVVTHAGIQDAMLGRWNRHIAEFCLYGDVTGIDAQGRPLRRDWAAMRQADAQAPLIVYGHTVVDELQWVNRTIDLDTGCVFGGQLSALRYPELELVQVPAAGAYSVRRSADAESDT